MATVEFGVLGMMRMSCDGTEIDPPSETARRLMALMLCRMGTPVTLDLIVDQLWAGSPPRTARKAVQVYVHRLRRLFGEPSLIVHDQHGYRLVAERVTLDSTLFDAWSAQARELTRSGRLSAAGELYTQSLALWRGPVAYADIDNVQIVDTERARLEDRRLAVLEEHLANELELGRHQDVIGQAAHALAEHPFRERLHAVHMLALYRSGRKVEALGAYRALRGRLRDELGLDPSPELQRLHQRMLNNDLGLEPRRRDVHARQRFLPRDVPGFSGRKSALDTLSRTTDANATVVISAIAGMAGVGKTALAVHWGHRMADRFPDGQFYVDLRGFDAGPPLSALEALTYLLRCMGTPPEQVPTDQHLAAALFRSTLAGKRALLILDNAHSAEQVRPLLPGDAGCIVLVASRRRLAGLIAIDGAAQLTLDTLDRHEATTLLEVIIGRERVRAEANAADAIVRLCAGLPLALRIAAARLADDPDRPLASYAAELARPDRLDVLSLEGDENRAVQAVLDQSYAALSDREQRTFCYLGMVPGPDFTAESVSELAAIDLDEAAALLEALASWHLVRDDDGRFSMHDLIAEYARHRLGDGEPGRAALRRLLEFLGRSVEHRNGSIMAGQRDGGTPDAAAQAMTWLENERANLVAAVDAAASRGWPELAWRIARPLWRFFHFAGHTIDWITTFERALGAMEASHDPAIRADLINSLGGAYMKAGRHDEALAMHTECVRIRTQLGDLDGLSRSHANLATTYEFLGRYPEAFEHLDRAVESALAAGDRLFAATLTGNLRLSLLIRTGHFLEALETGQKAFPTIEELGSPFDMCLALCNLADAHRKAGKPREAMAYASRQIELSREVKSPHWEAGGLDELARVHRTLGDYDRAAELHLAAIDLAGRHGTRAERCGMRLELADTWMAASRPDEALAILHEVLAEADELGLEHMQARARDILEALLRDTKTHA